MAETDEANAANAANPDWTVESLPADIRAGRDLAGRGKNDEAFAAYRRELNRCKAELDYDDRNKDAQKDFRRGVARIGLLADRLLLAGQWPRALKFANEAITEGASRYWVAPKDYDALPANTEWLRLVRAYALMFLGSVAKHAPTSCISTAIRTSVGHTGKT